MQEKGQNIAPIKGRILQYIDYKKIKKSYFLEKTTISASNFKSSGLKSEIGGDKMALILSKFPDINAKWLLTGNGEMLLSEDDKIISGLEKTQECKKCEVLEKEIQHLQEIIESKNETIKAYQSTNSETNGGSKRTSA
ncbi:hypothetical protein L3073_05945 [Ancylomarina sp. DW003]|nr:hypothetical protein [Ancylomarina sp. DW003]MDE5421742.1 hypothetical protein [Ancylomarina sp. DW003]